ncbi:MAG: hypothetical protein V4472_04750 [Pseudomonadota bacterium]
MIGSSSSRDVLPTGSFPASGVTIRAAIRQEKIVINTFKTVTAAVAALMGYR